MSVSQRRRHQIAKILPYVFIVLVVALTLLFQVRHPFFINGIDSFFHMSIAYDTYRQLVTGHFSYFLSGFGFYHSLRIVNAVYGPLGGYLSGFLLLIAGNWIRWEILTFFITFTIAGISMYQLCQYWKVTKVYSALISCLYIFSFPMMSFWLNSQYDGLGAAFIPWILYFGSLILNHESFKSWKLVLLLVILAELHVFSLLLGLLVLGLCLLMSLVINPGRKRLILKVIKILFLTAIMSFNVWGGIFEVLGSNHNRLVSTYSFPNMFKNIWSSVFYNQSAPLSQNIFLLGLSATILLIFTLGLYLLNVRHFNARINFIMIILGVGFLWLSSRLFPWPALQKVLPILNTDLQFPKRFLPVSLSAFGLILGISLTKLSSRIHNHCFFAIVMTIILGMFLIHAWQNNQYQSQYLYHQQTTAEYYGEPFYHATKDAWLNGRQPQKLTRSLSGRDPGRYFKIVSKDTPDYLPSPKPMKSNFMAYTQYERQVIQNRLPCRIHFKAHSVMISFERRSRRVVTLPFVKYAHTRVIMNGKKLRRPQLTSIGALRTKPRVGNNTLSFKYMPSRIYKEMVWVSIVIWIWFIVSMIHARLVKNRS